MWHRQVKGDRNLCNFPPRTVADQKYIFNSQKVEAAVRKIQNSIENCSDIQRLISNGGPLIEGLICHIAETPDISTVTIENLQALLITREGSYRTELEQPQGATLSKVLDIQAKGRIHEFTLQLPQILQSTLSYTTELKIEEIGFIYCICGIEDNLDRTFWIQCDRCWVWQHGSCVGIDTEPPDKATYYCQGCLQNEKCLEETFRRSRKQTNPCSWKDRHNRVYNHNWRDYSQILCSNNCTKLQLAAHNSSKSPPDPLIGQGYEGDKDENNNISNVALGCYSTQHDYRTKQGNFSVHYTTESIRHVQGLSEDGKLDDTVINSFLSLIAEDQYPSVLPLNSFAWNYGQIGKLRIWKDKHNDLKYVLLPFYSNSHWSLVVLNLQKKLIEYHDSLAVQAPKRNQVFQQTKRFIEEDIDIKDWKYCWYPSGPRQVGGTDCGIYVCVIAYQNVLGLAPTLPHDKVFPWRINIANLLQSNTPEISDSGIPQDAVGLAPTLPQDKVFQWRINITTLLQCNTPAISDSRIPQDVVGSAAISLQPTSVDVDMNLSGSDSRFNGMKNKRQRWIDKHGTSLDGKTNWTCNLCNRTLGSNASFYTHLRKSHKSRPPQNKPQIHCEVCGKKYLLEGNLNRHMDKRHRFSYKPRCGRPSKHQRKVIQHTSTEIGGPKKIRNLTILNNQYVEIEEIDAQETCSRSEITKTSAETDGAEKTRNPTIPNDQCVEIEEMEPQETCSGSEIEAKISAVTDSAEKTTSQTLPSYQHAEKAIHPSTASFPIQQQPIQNTQKQSPELHTVALLELCFQLHKVVDILGELKSHRSAEPAAPRSKTEATARKKKIEPFKVAEKEVVEQRKLSELRKRLILAMIQDLIDGKSV